MTNIISNNKDYKRFLKEFGDKIYIGDLIASDKIKSLIKEKFGTDSISTERIWLKNNLCPFCNSDLNEMVISEIENYGYLYCTNCKKITFGYYRYSDKGVALNIFNFTSDNGEYVLNNSCLDEVAKFVVLNTIADLRNA